nr:cellulose synthase [Tanacetum cinerariifolium]
MAASSSTAPFLLDLYHNGYFKVKPLTYIDSEKVTVNIDVTGFKFEDMKEYVETKTHSVVTRLYYFNQGLNNINCDADFTVFVEMWQSNEDRMAQLYVDHKNANLGDYILVELKPGYDFDNSDDEFSDVASLDHLFEGEDELRQVRIEKGKALVLHNDSDDNDCEVDPLFSNLDDDSKKDKVHVEPEINSDEDMPIIDEDEIGLPYP